MSKLEINLDSLDKFSADRYALFLLQIAKKNEALKVVTECDYCVALRMMDSYSPYTNNVVTGKCSCKSKEANNG